ncbi:hypothetical protein VM1G_11947 [Cytospora mali]|uniref:Uncharacterized protein n=1 Tax=Cytospora mali TaxID=578113 RepID=A0A194WD94_CYTMA|nr:hypothetical protein VM1G_11947 [Valsa mali]
MAASPRGDSNPNDPSGVSSTSARSRIRCSGDYGADELVRRWLLRGSADYRKGFDAFRIDCLVLSTEGRSDAIEP